MLQPNEHQADENGIGWHPVLSREALMNCEDRDIIKRAFLGFIWASKDDQLSDFLMVPENVHQTPDPEFLRASAWAMELWLPEYRLLNIHAFLIWLACRRALIQCPPQLLPVFSNFL
jgi:hypothetical protein